ncbi:aminotransferase-like domain-containing protein [Pseudoduganella namucuonensis]|uniref:Transcriptional regulator, GntR family n=1 Tax=Pseudoduganella namucuonensis TaxID=1035707 RepID=A0A1I7J968_9BURK|nr:PLP-dependent aminotransferase family protein [Pseudoduganella namucuonensis]SFU81723.1 transcriptional regulator, GntR family [Pseudoduganella namucuonensis]
MQINLYEQLANELGGHIAERVFAPGDRLPSIRHLAQQKRLSISTVLQALRLMEDRGLIEARPQAGYYVRHRARMLAVMTDTEHLKEPAFVGINNLLMRVLKANETPGVVQLGSAWPPDELLPIKRIQKGVSAVARRDPALLGKVSCYEINEPAFVRQVVRRALDWGKLDPAEIVSTSSCTEAISLCLRAVAKPGDTIAIESATYFVLLQLIESLGMKALEIPTHPTTGPSIDALELAFNAGLVQACLFIPNANNPLGCIMPEENKKRLAALLSHHGIPLIEDDVYGDLCFTHERPWPVKAYDTTGHVLLCSSFSKAVSPASRVGYVVAGRWAQEVALLKMVSSGSTSTFFQAVLADFLTGSSYEIQVRKMRRALAQRIARMSDAVAASFPHECSISEPQGGFVLWVQMPPQVDALALHGRAVGQGVAFMPGQLFSASGKYGNYLRLNCGNAWSPEVEGAVARLGALVRSEADSPSSLPRPVF